MLVKKKSGSLRLCVDYRDLNKITKRDNYPIPLIDDQIDMLRGKKYFTRLDLKDAFHHVQISEDSIKLTSFVTPMGQFEYLKMPFGLKNSPATFMRFIHHAFQNLISDNKVIIYLDDILIATETVEKNLEILKEVYKILVDNVLELRLDKCQFLQTETSYLGYIIKNNTIKPNPENVRAVEEFPVPTNFKSLQSFLGLASYFRRFIKNFSLLAKPLYDLLKCKNATEFLFDKEALDSFETIKQLLISEPILRIYSPNSETQLHCDASSIGFASVLMQKQEDGKFHPVMYFSKRTSEAETKYHSFELETLAIVYSLQRFKIYLQGLTFKIITDCNSLKQTLEKKNVNPRILRWSLILHDFDYTIEHRKGELMKHVDALSRVNVLAITENTFEQNLIILQGQDPEITKIRTELTKTESPKYELLNGVVYKKDKEKLLFYVPNSMISNVIRKYHDEMSHIGCEKVIEIIRRTYWFPKMKDVVKEYIGNCLKCITYSSKARTEGHLHPIPKGNLPCETIHIDHLGPFEKSTNQNKHLLVVVDGFTKFVRLFPCRTTNAKEVIKHLSNYFRAYSRPSRIISDRGTAFTSDAFKEFLRSLNIQQILIATGSPKANGQAERVNRVISPMIAKMTTSTNKWDLILDRVEYAINNTNSKSTGKPPSVLLFGFIQKGGVEDDLREVLIKDDNVKMNLDNVRKNAELNIEKTQVSQKHRL